MYVIPTTVMPDRPTPVSSRVANRLGTSHAHAFNSDITEYQIVVTTSARLRPTRSENAPALVAPMNMPMKEADVIVAIVAIDRCHCCRSAGAA
jgi:hypothetical protein